MLTMKEATDEFLAQKRIAVVGVRTTTQDAANAIYKKFKDAGYEVFAVNPKTDSYYGDPCYPDLQSIPGGVDGAVFVLRPEISSQVMEDCIAAGVKSVWMHGNFFASSISEQATRVGRQNGITVIDGGCPMMYCEPVDFGHKCMRWISGITGSLPKEVS
jgi:predicted CoA-binding protein